MPAGTIADYLEPHVTDHEHRCQDIFPILLGLNGPKKSGKDTSFRGIQALLRHSKVPGWAEPQIGWTARRDGFADRLKLSAANALGHLTDDVDDAVAFVNSLKGEKEDGSDVVIEVLQHGSHEEGTWSKVLAKITGRQFQQYYGTEAHRDVFGYDFWIDVVLPNRDLAVDGAPFDAFFGRSWPDQIGWSEILVITDARFDNEAEAIRGLSGQVWRVQRDEVDEFDGHSSEQPLSGELVDVVIDNNGDLFHLSEGLATALERQYGFLPFDHEALLDAEEAMRS